MAPARAAWQQQAAAGLSRPYMARYCGARIVALLERPAYAAWLQCCASQKKLRSCCHCDPGRCHSRGPATYGSLPTHRWPRRCRKHSVLDELNWEGDRSKSAARQGRYALLLPPLPPTRPRCRTSCPGQEVQALPVRRAPSCSRPLLCKTALKT